MTKRIDVPGVGVVEFPENMSDEQITNAIRTNIMPKYAAKPETALQTFGRSAASIPDTALNLVTGALDVAAYPFARAYYGMTGNRTPEEAAALAQQQTTSPKDVIGRALGVAGTPGYENAPQRQLGNYLGQTLSEGIINPLTETTGLPEQDVSSMFNSLTMAVPGMAKGGYQAVKPALQATRDVVGGAVGRGTGYIAKPGEAPAGYQVPSQRAPLRDTVMLPEDMARFERGEMPYGQMPTEVPIQQLPRNAVERTALKMSGGEIPYQGQAARAFGERLGETYRNPITAAIDIGSLFTTGVPLMTAARTGLAGVQGVADAILARRGLDPNLPTRLADYQSGARPMPGAPGPVAPADIMSARQGRRTLQPNPQLRLPAPPIYVAPEGVAGTNINQVSQAGAQQKYAPQPIPQTPAQQSQQLAAQKLQQVQQAPTISPQQQAILDQIRARKNQPPEGGTPVVNTPQPKPAPTGGGSLFDPNTLPSKNWNATEGYELQQALKKLQDNPPPPMSAADEASMAKQVAESQKASNEAIINDFATQGNSDKIDMIGQTIPVDMGKDAFNASNATRGMATYLLKNGVDSIPVLPGMTEAQTVHAIAERMKGITRTGRGKPDVLEMKVGKEELPTGISSLSKEVTGEIYASKEAYDKAMLFKTLEEDVPRASYIEGDKLITVFPQNIPKDIIKSAGISPMGTIIRDAKTGKVIKD